MTAPRNITYRGDKYIVLAKADGVYICARSYFTGVAKRLNDWVSDRVYFVPVKNKGKSKMHP